MTKLRPIRVEGGLAYVPLTRGYEAIIDAEDVPLVDAWNWSAVVELRASGAIRAVYAKRAVYEKRKGRGCGRRSQTILMHRVIAGTPGEMTTDHVDGNGLNNRRQNLRWATVAENIRNMQKPEHNTSGVKGVCWDTRKKRWLARIRLNGKLCYLGLFRNIDEAAEAYAEASHKMHGKFGRVA